MKWIGTEHELPEGSLMVGFGSDPVALDAKNVSEVQYAFAAFVPGAKVLKVDAHDWNSDPYSLSTWMAFRSGQITRFGTGLRRPEGWLTFATADMAIGLTGYIDGAIESGSRSAERARELLDARAPSAERCSSLQTVVQLEGKGNERSMQATCELCGRCLGEHPWLRTAPRRKL